jgi:hypothetical protein
MMLAPDMNRYARTTLRQIETVVHSARLLTEAWETACSRPGARVFEGLPQGLASVDLFSLNKLHDQLASDLKDLDIAALMAVDEMDAGNEQGGR